ncbi:MAG: patatin-like phospholipase family protein [Patiriisocius sp.]|uniref:patatin-like phospholipase family protein n=1 Tax=Patiriisocius sp. TaxID=2822396 RepID=UPI003EF4731E
MTIAQVPESTPKKDLKVGLVLSGGGAKGLAHIGVLKAIDSAGVRLDYIGGTSMGAIIGGLYASGYSGKQIDSIFKEVDFNRLIQDDIPRSATTFYEKAEDEKYGVTLPFDGFKIRFPSGLSKGQNVYNLLSKLMAHVDTTDDFSQLPIPFFCMATNLETGKEVLLENGYLPRAILASGALPSLFSPVIINDQVLIDGGVVNNYPIEQLRKKGVDVIIGVDVQDVLRDKDGLRSAFDALVQINNYRTIEAMVAKKAATDVYIRPEIRDFSVVSFDEGRRIIKNGYEAAMVFEDVLNNYSSQQQTSAREVVKFQQNDNIEIRSVEVNGTNKYTEKYVLGKLKLKLPALTTFRDFSNGVNNLSATGNYNSIDYRFIEDEDGSYKVVFNVNETKQRMSLRFGVHYDDLYRTSALVNLTYKRLLTNNDVASVDVIIGDNFRYNANYYIDKGYYWSIGLNSSFDFFEKDIPISLVNDPGFIAPEGLNQLELQYNDFTNRLFFETLFKRTFTIGTGVEHKYLRLLSETLGIDEQNNLRTVFESTNYYSAFGYAKYDSLDDPFFPSSGFFLDGDIHFYAFAEGRNNDFEQFAIPKAKFGYATKIFDKFSMYVTAGGGFKIGDDTTKSLDFLLGGYGFKNLNNIIPFYGYEALSIRGDTYLKSMLSIDYEIFKKSHIQIFGNIANVGDDLLVDAQWIDGIDYSGFGIGYGLETFMGPVEVRYAHSPERSTGEWHVSAGFRF